MGRIKAVETKRLFGARPQVMAITPVENENQDLGAKCCNVIRVTKLIPLCTRRSQIGTDKLPDMVGKKRGLIYGDQGIAVRDLDESAVRERRCQLRSMCTGHNPVFACPHDQHWPIECRNGGRRSEKIPFASTRVAGVFAVVPSNSSLS